MKTLLHADLIVRDFGMAAVRVDDLLRWTKTIGATLPATVPDIQGFEMAHLETLLCAIESAVPGMTDSAVIEIAASIPCDAKLRAMIDEGDAQLARWLVGANVHLQWRQRLQRGIAVGDLQPVDALSGLPLKAVSPADGASSPPAEPLLLPPRKPIMQANRERVLSALRAAGYEPGALPAVAAGKVCPAKAAARQRAQLSRGAFDHAWGDLSESGEIRRATLSTTR